MTFAQKGRFVASYYNSRYRGIWLAPCQRTLSPKSATVGIIFMLVRFRIPDKISAKKSRITPTKTCNASQVMLRHLLQIYYRYFLRICLAIVQSHARRKISKYYQRTTCYYGKPCSAWGGCPPLCRGCYAAGLPFFHALLPGIRFKRCIRVL